jgi:hypothetical protein
MLEGLDLCLNFLKIIHIQYHPLAFAEVADKVDMYSL